MAKVFGDVFFDRSRIVDYMTSPFFLFFLELLAIAKVFAFIVAVAVITVVN